jgi:hypothetical protein
MKPHSKALIIVVDDNAPQEKAEVDTLLAQLRREADAMGFDVDFSFVLARPRFQDPFVVYTILGHALRARQEGNRVAGFILDAYSRDPGEEKAGGLYLAEILMGKRDLNQDIEQFDNALTKLFGPSMTDWPNLDMLEYVSEGIALVQDLPFVFYTTTYLDIAYPNARVFRRSLDFAREMLEFIAHY